MTSGGADDEEMIHGAWMVRALEMTKRKEECYGN
jgi:hypothetical protein